MGYYPKLKWFGGKDVFATTVYDELHEKSLGAGWFNTEADARAARANPAASTVATTAADNQVIADEADASARFKGA